MRVRFEANRANLSVYFDDLSDGEKCFFLGDVVLAANKFYALVPSFQPGNEGVKL